MNWRLKMRYLIIGASGFLGQTIYYKLKSSGKKVWGTYSSHKIDQDLIKLDVIDTEELLNIYTLQTRRNYLDCDECIN